MKTIRSVSLLAFCALVMAGSAMVVGDAAASTPQQIAANPELVVAAIQGQNAEASAAIVAQALSAIFASDWSAAVKRERCIALIAYAVAAKGRDAAPMMGLVVGQVPAAWLPVVAATAVVAAGDNSPAVADAMLAALAGNAQALAACREACNHPWTILRPGEMTYVRGITLPSALRPALQYD